MIEKNYSRHIGNHSDAMVRIAVLDIADTADANMVPIRRRKHPAALGNP